MTATHHARPWSSAGAPRLGAYLATIGASLGIVAGVVELTLGPHLRSWVGSKQDTTRLGLATITLGAVALLAAVTWLQGRATSPGTRLLVVLGLILPGLTCFTTVGRAWYLPGAMLVVAAAMAATDLREDAREVLETISRRWLAALTVILGAFYVFLGATALGVAGMFGILGGVMIIAVVALSSRIPTRVAAPVLVVATLPFAVLTWWSIVTPLLATLVVAIGWFALRGSASQHEPLRMRPADNP